MHRLFRIKAYEAEHGPHFDEEMARKAVSKMENEDGSRGQHWSIEETTSLANQHGIRMDEKFNKYDWYVALNMVYSDYYRVIVNMTNSNNPKHFVELAKAWMCDKDIEEGKMWYYYVYIMNQNTLSLRDSNLANTQAILQKIDNFENIYRQDKMDRLTSENLALKGQISQANQNQYIAATVQANTAPIVNRLNSLQSDVDGIKCKLPNTVSVPYPQLAVYNPEIARAAAYGAFAGENYGLNTQCGCC